MRQLLPTAFDEVDPYDAYRPGDPHAPLLRVNMVASVDGAATDEEGRTGRLGGTGDHEIFRALRALADAILVGAGTVRVEGYGPHRLSARLRERRVADGRPRAAPIVVVSRSLDIDFTTPMFTEAEVATVVLTCSAAPADRRRAAERAGRVVVAGDDAVDPVHGVAALREELGLASLLCEGGPVLNDSLFDAGLVDELCLTLSPRLIGRGPRILGNLARPGDLELIGLYEQDSELYTRYAVVPS
ncbi:MAG TPA: dihydrofolate reductase family protein [Egibacteraceae bacterium]|jgi:riboflavin biosynthesis pyrimidine reductase|nr:dihydrofolate reductase family protein [Egibacteraceae bacterium]